MLFHLIAFYGISTLIGYLMPNFVFIYIYVCACVYVCLCVCVCVCVCVCTTTQKYLPNLKMCISNLKCYF